LAPVRSSNDGTDVGGNSDATGNNIFNYGSASNAFSLSGFPGTSNVGILVSLSTNANIAYNRVSGSSPVNNYGIYLRSTGTAPSITHTSNIVSNLVTDTTTSNTTSDQLIGIYSDMGGALHTLNINKNKVTRCAAHQCDLSGIL
jgi:hypothetical protein